MNTPITVSVLVNSSLVKAWDVFTNAQHIVGWNFASDDWHCPAATSNPVTGGSFSATMAAKDGSFSFDFGGVYDEVIPMQLLRYQMGDKRAVSVSFSESNGQVLVTETFDPESENPREMQESGWQAILNNYKSYCESLNK